MDDIPAHINRVKSKVEELQRTGFSFNKDLFLGIAMQLDLPQGFSNVNTVLNARLRGSPDTHILARETEEAIRAETHRVNTTTTEDYPNIGGHSRYNSRSRSPETLRRDTQPNRDVYRPPHQATPGVNKPFFRITENTPPHLQRCFDCGNKGHWAKTTLCPHSRPTRVTSLLRPPHKVTFEQT